MTWWEELIAGLGSFMLYIFMGALIAAIFAVLFSKKPIDRDDWDSDDGFMYMLTVVLWPMCAPVAFLWGVCRLVASTAELLSRKLAR